MRRRKLRIILYLLALLCLLVGLGLTYVYSAVRFTGLLLCLAGGGITLLALVDRWSEKSQSGVLAKRVLAVLVVLGLLLFAVLECAVIGYANRESDEPVSAVIVLGAGVNGTVPSLSLRSRLEAALEYISDKPDVPVIVTGSQGAGEEITEARCMADWLIAHGVDEQRILLEEQADDTEQNIAYSKALLTEYGYDVLDNIAVVTNDYHLCRAAVHWETPGMIPVAAKMPPPYQNSLLTVNYYIREAFALAAELPNVVQFFINSYL